MSLTGIKAVFGKAMAMGLLAGAVPAVAPAQAEAQQFVAGVQFGPEYHDGFRPGFYDRFRYEREQKAIARREAWVRHERWERERVFRYGARRWVYVL